MLPIISKLFPRLTVCTRQVSDFNMIGQKKISSFFKSAAPKRASSMDTSPKQENPEKKRKLNDLKSIEGPSILEGRGSKSCLIEKPEKMGKLDDLENTKELRIPEGKPSTSSLVNSECALTPLSPTRDDSNLSNGAVTESPPREKPSPLAVALSPAQRADIAEKQLGAKLKLATKNTHGLVRDFGLSWFKALQGEFTKPYFLQLAKFVEGERQKSTVFPPPDQVFTFTRMSEIKDVKVVIIGQDPYHGLRQAHGLSFSVQKGIKPPPSLENMYKELKSDVEGFEHPGHGNLTGWAKQGVLMLNACLTVRAHQANSHQGKGWEKFTDAIIAWFNKNRPGLVFILWGSYAQKKGAQIDKKRHCVLKGVHPSPLSAHRGFFGSKPYSQCNKYLKEHQKKPIDWKDLPEC